MSRSYARGGFVALLCCCVLFPLPGAGCIWDRDTLAMEGKGLPDTVNVLVGRFERQPPAYYEMRLARVGAAIRDGKGQLADYDDAGVAADRLKRGDVAIEWMRLKKTRLDRLGEGDPAHKEHLYRYHANLGTFHAHRWLGRGASRERLDDLKAAREHIARAIELNPDAHFGRERYQLMAIDWLLALPAEGGKDELTLFWAAKEKLGENAVGFGLGQLKQAGFGDAAKGLSGLIVLGDAWESVDIFHALALALEDQGHAGLAYLARLRATELVEQGRRSLHPRLHGEALKQALERRGKYHDHQTVSRSYFMRARKAAEAWHEHRRAFMAARLEQGRHPDTDAGFWQGYEELANVDLPGGSLIPKQSLHVPLALAGVGLLAGLGLWRKWRHRPLPARE